MDYVSFLYSSGHAALLLIDGALSADGKLIKFDGALSA